MTAFTIETLAQLQALWDAQRAAPAVPSVGTILQALMDGSIDGRRYDRDLPARQRSTLY